MSDFSNTIFNAETKSATTTPEQLLGNTPLAASSDCESDTVNADDILFLNKLNGLMEENLDNQNFNLNHLARKLYINRTHFFRKVKIHTNQTPFALLLNFRLNKAKEILSKKKMAINEVYVMTSFKSRTHFVKVFKDKYNSTPSKYAKKNDEN